MGGACRRGPGRLSSGELELQSRDMIKCHSVLGEAGILNVNCNSDTAGGLDASVYSPSANVMTVLKIATQN